MWKNTLVEFLFYFAKNLDKGPLPTLMKYPYGKDEYKLSGYKTTYSTGEKWYKKLLHILVRRNSFRCWPDITWSRTNLKMREFQFYTTLVIYLFITINPFLNLTWHCTKRISVSIEDGQIDVNHANWFDSIAHLKYLN